MTNATRHEDVPAFFDAFCAAFATFRGTEVARLYHVPNVALRSDGSVDCMTSSAEVAGFFQHALDEYHRQGCRTCHYDDLEVVPIGDRSTLATVTWALMDERGDVRLTWRQSYNLIDVSGTWQALTSTDHVIAMPRR